jgi:hypothetical protein
MTTQSAASRGKTTWIEAVVQGFCLIGALAAVALFGWIRSDNVLLAEVLTACVAILVLFRFGDVVKLKWLGLELERATQKAVQATEEAKASAAQLRALAAIVGKLELDNLALRNRFGQLPPRTLMAIRDKLIDALRVVGCSADEIAEAKRLLESSIRYDLVLKIGGPAGKALMDSCPKKHEDEQYKTFVKKWGDLSSKGGWISPAPSADFRALLDEFEIKDEEARQRLSEFELYDRTGQAPSYVGDTNYFET